MMDSIIDWDRDRGRVSKMGRTKIKGMGKCKGRGNGRGKYSSSERGSVREGTGAGTKKYAGTE